MQVKKKYNHGGIHNWPPDTEVMASDNTSVAAPQLTFLTSQLLNQPSGYVEERRDENLARLGLDGPSLRNQTLRDELQRDAYVEAVHQQKIQGLMQNGFTREAAEEHIEQSKMLGTITPVAPVMEFLSPVGDVMALRDAAALALQGEFGAAGVTGGLAVASIFTPGTVRSDAITDDYIRSMALSNARAGQIDNRVVDIIEYIQEVATPGNISFGATRSAASGGGPRAFREPRVGRPPSATGGTGHMRDYITRPDPNVADSPYQSGRSVGAALGARGSGVSDLQLQQASQILRSAREQPVVRPRLNPSQEDYYQGIIDEISLVQTRGRVGVEPLPHAPRPRPGSEVVRVDAGAASAAPAPKPDLEEVQIGVFGDEPFNTYTINKANPGSQSRDRVTKMQTQPDSKIRSGVEIKMTAKRQPDGQIDHDFLLVADKNSVQGSQRFRDRVNKLVDDGMGMDEAMQVATKEADDAINAGLRRMYSEVPVGQNINTYDYSADSYPLILQGIRGGKYQTIRPAGELLSGPADLVEFNRMNMMGSNLNLFKRLKSKEFGSNLDIIKREDQFFESRVNGLKEEFMRGKPATPKNLADAEDYAIKARILQILNGLSRANLSRELRQQVGDVFANHINKQITDANNDAIDALTRYRAREKGISLQEAEVEIMNEFIPLPRAVYDRGLIIPTPRVKKIRAEKGVYLTVPKFRMNKKKAAYGMRVKK